MTPKETVWELKDHSAAKHEILRSYLQAWFPILSKYHSRLIYFDGFAGPGRYQGGEPGSPLVAIDVARRHLATLAGELVFIFVEADRSSAQSLRKEIAALELPSHFKWHVENRGFEHVLSNTLDQLDDQGLHIAPTFALIDPFGITGLPMEIIRRLLKRQHCEVLITFMNHAIRRWVTELPAQVDTLFGMTGAAEKIASASDRIASARELYSQALHQSATYVRFFEIRNTRGGLVYDLFFATNHWLGHYRMKEAMWKLDPDSGYRFSGGMSPHEPSLFDPQPGLQYAPQLWEHFRGKTVFSDAVLLHTRDKTPYLNSHARTALKLLESGEVSGCPLHISSTKRDGTRRRKNTYAAGTRLTFREVK